MSCQSLVIITLHAYLFDKELYEHGHIIDSKLTTRKHDMGFCVRTVTVRGAFCVHLTRC